MPLRAIQVPAISCVIPAFNEGPNLRRLTRAVLGTLAGLSDRLELIVVDDGSRTTAARDFLDRLEAPYRPLALRLVRPPARRPLFRRRRVRRRVPRRGRRGRRRLGAHSTLRSRSAK
jgi:glycosyltransferase involved in cell wall biosynthesis